MTRLDFDVPFMLPDDRWTLVVNGLDIDQDLILRVEDQELVLSDPDSADSGPQFLTMVDGAKLIFHIDLKLFPTGQESFSLQILARSSAFLHWHLKSPRGYLIDSEGLNVESGERLEILYFECLDSWQLTSRKRDISARVGLEGSSRRLPLELRPLHQLARNLDLAGQARRVAAIVDSSASMLKVQQGRTMLAVIEAIRAISLVTSFEPLKIRIAGHPGHLELGVKQRVDEALKPVLLGLERTYREVEPMMSLVPDSLSQEDFVPPGSKIFAISDTWFFIGPKLERLLEARDLELNLIKIIDHDSGDFPIRFSNPRVRVHSLIGLDDVTSPEKVLRAIA
jgi:hypothetical protein